MLAFQSSENIAEERLHTLSQIYLEIQNGSISDHNVHFQLYTFSDLFLKALRRSFPWLSNGPNWLLSRLLVTMFFLHSDDSGRLMTVLDAPVGGRAGELHVRFEYNSRTRVVVRAFVRLLLSKSRRLGFLPLMPLLKLMEPGRAYHAGGSFPMAGSPEGLQSDKLGRPFGWRRIHIVDASVFPSIAAPTITYTAMANAHRIASLASQD